MDGADRALRMGAATKDRGHDCDHDRGGEGRGETASETWRRWKHVVAEFAHHSVPDWSKSGRMCTNRCHLDTIALPA
jgi:hypothetical protein